MHAERNRTGDGTYRDTSLCTAPRPLSDTTKWGAPATPLPVLAATGMATGWPGSLRPECTASPTRQMLVISFAPAQLLLVYARCTAYGWRHDNGHNTEPALPACALIWISPCTGVRSSLPTALSLLAAGGSTHAAQRN